MLTNDLLYWMDERENVRMLKEDDQPKPWSQDKVFQTTYFCNVRREDDRVTRWIRQNWPMGDFHQIHLVAMAVARFVNKPSTLEKLEYPHNGFTVSYCNHFVHTMVETTKPWGGAYIVSTNGRKMPKHQYIATLLAAIDRACGTVEYTTLAHTYAQLLQFDGLGSFMAGQLIADMKNTEDHLLTYAPDWQTWCAHGPGSLRGMAWVLDQGRCTPAKFYKVFPMLHAAVQKAGWEKIHAQDLQNCLCEFDKYCRVKNGTGRSKRKYDGGQ